MDNKLKITNYLGKNIKKGYTMHQLSKILRIPYASFYRSVQQMKDLLVIETIGKSKVMRLNIFDDVIKAYLIISSYEERKDYLIKKPIIRKIASELKTKDVVIIFGSYAKGKEIQRSDIDILIINKDGKKSISFSKYELLYQKKINPIFITKKEFKNMLKDKEENVGKQALKNHIQLNNPEEFWRLVLSGI